MTTLTFYGKRIPATHRNMRLLMFGFYPAVLILAYTVLGLNAWALSEVTGLTIWLTLPVLILMGLEFTFNAFTVSILPAALRSALNFGLTIMSLYVFWEKAERVKFVIVSVYVTHLVAHRLLSRYWARKAPKAPHGNSQLSDMTTVSTSEEPGPKN